MSVWLASDAVLVAYAVVLALLGLFGLHRLYLVALYSRFDSGRTVVAPPDPREWPPVTVQLPVYNERFVAERLLRAVAALDYPRERLEVQVLDDSTDDTRERLAAAAAELREAGINVRYVHRGDRHGFKAGALEAGLRTAQGDLVCVFDADFVPRPDFLLRAVPHFASADVGMVQARWGHLNRRRSLLTRIQAVLLDAHFAIEHGARHGAGRYFNFNGTAGVWRRQAIEQAGGWQHDTLTEDLDLSYRAQLAGWRFVYLNDVEAPAQLPESIAAFKSQQRRWTRGAVQTARKLLPKLWRSSVPLTTKVEATVHLTSNLAYVLMVGLALLVSPAMALREQSLGTMLVWLELPVLLFGTGSVCVYFVAAQRAVGRSRLAAALRLPALMALGAGLALNNTVAVLRGLFGPTGEFVRTPKTGEVTGDRAAYRARPSVLPWIESGIALYFTAVVVVAVRNGMWLGLPVAVLFLVGYGMMAALALRDSLGSRIRIAGPSTQ